MDDPLWGARTRADYNGAEQGYSRLLRQALHELVQGKRNELWLLRRYAGDPHRLGVMPLPPARPGAGPRLAVVETLVRAALAFVCPDAAGGPVAQGPAPDGGVLEEQLFATRFPHIVLERLDHYTADGAPVATTWCLRRVQNQRAQVQVNRLLDAANLAFELVRLIR